MANSAEKQQGMSLATKVKLIASLVFIVVALIVIFQNTESVTTYVLWAEFSMPRALLLLLMLGVGFGAGALVTGAAYRRRRK